MRRGWWGVEGHCVVWMALAIVFVGEWMVMVIVEAVVVVLQVVG